MASDKRIRAGLVLEVVFRGWGVTITAAGWLPLLRHAAELRLPALMIRNHCRNMLMDYGFILVSLPNVLQAMRTNVHGDGRQEVILNPMKSGGIYLAR
jgi:hypothetical protein